MAKERHNGYLEPKNEELFKAQSEKRCTLKKCKKKPFNEP